MFRRLQAFLICFYIDVGLYLQEIKFGFRACCGLGSGVFLLLWFLDGAAVGFSWEDKEGCTYDLGV